MDSMTSANQFINGPLGRVQYISCSCTAKTTAEIIYFLFSIYTVQVLLFTALINLLQATFS